MREIRTIETEKYEKAEDKPGLLRRVGMITGQEAFDLLKAHLEEVGLLPDEYFSPSPYGNLDQELPDFRTAICHTDWGTSEGIYIDIDLLYAENKEMKQLHLATGKTLSSSGEAFLKMSRIAAECSMMLNGRGDIVRVPESSYGNEVAKETTETKMAQEDNKIKVDLGFATLVAEQGSDPNYPREVFVGLEDEQGGWSQDLAIIGSKYHYEEGEVVYDGDISMKVFTDKNNDDYTHDFTIQVYTPEEERSEVSSLAKRLESATTRAAGASADTRPHEKVPEWTEF